MKQWPAGVNSCFAEVTENDILRMKDITIPNDTKKATKLEMINVSDKKTHCEPLVAVWLRPSTTKPCIYCKQVAEKPRGEHLKMMYFNTQFAYMSGVFPDRQASLMPLSLNNNCPSTLYFKVPSKLTQLPLSKTSPFKKFECRNLSLK